MSLNSLPEDTKSGGYISFFMLNSAEHEILKLISIKISRNSAFLRLRHTGMLFFLLMTVKMPTIVGILTFVSRKNSCSAEMSMKNFS